MKRLLCWLMVLCLLLAGCSPASPAPEPELPQETVVTLPPVIEENPQEEAETLPPAVEIPAEEWVASAPQEEYKASAPVEDTPQPAPPPETAVQVPAAEPEKEPVCLLSICCKKALAHEGLNPALRQLLPQDGWLLPQAEVAITPGESVFDVLLRTVRQQGIHMEFVDAAVYGSAYIEGIGQLYEFACGGQSGWVYSVNGQSPNVGCSSYAVSDGDIIVWEYITERT